MKRLTLILLFLVPAISSAQLNIIDNQTDSAHVTDYIRNGLEALDISGVNVTAIDQTHEWVVRDNLTENGTVAYIYQSSDGKYIIVYNMELIGVKDKGVGLDITTAHELIHLKQRDSSRLFNFGKIVFYDGKPFHSDSVDYADRPWEEEAFLAQETIATKLNLK